jgi:HEAT repeat protein
MQGNLAEHGRSASFGPEAGLDPSVELCAAEEVVAVLWRAVQAFSLDSVTPEGIEAFDSLEKILLPYLETEQFLWVHVGHAGFRIRKTWLSSVSRPLAARLAASGIVEILFKRGVTRYELERVVRALHESSDSGAHSAATRLWEAGLRCVAFRCADEVLGSDDGREDLNSWQDSWPAGTEAVEHTQLVDDFAAALPVTPPADWRALVSLTAEDRPRLQSLRLEEPEILTERLARHLASLHDSERDAVRHGESLVLLDDVVDMLLAQRRFDLLHDVVAALSEGRGSGDSTLEPVVQRLCVERNVRILGAVLEDPEVRPEDLAAVRAILAKTPTAVDPLCRLLVRLEDIDARRLTCRVLALVAKEDPHALAQRAAGQPWYLARNVAYVLGRIGGGKVLPFLKRWVRHEDDRVRLEVARALGRSRDAGATVLLGELLEDASWKVRQSAVWSLAELRDAKALPRLRAILFDDRAFRARRCEERDDFFRTYGRLADASTFEELVHLVEQRQIVTVGWQAELRRGAVLALGESGRPQAARVLRGLERARDVRLREAVNEAMRSLRHHAAATLSGEDDWSVPARLAPSPRAESGFRLEFAEER